MRADPIRPCFSLHFRIALLLILVGSLRAACGCHYQPARKSPPAGGWLAVRNAWTNSFFHLTSSGGMVLVVAAGPHKQGLWVNYGAGWCNKPEGQLVPEGTTTAVMGRREARQLT